MPDRALMVLGFLLVTGCSGVGYRLHDAGHRGDYTTSYVNCQEYISQDKCRGTIESFQHSLLPIWSLYTTLGGAHGEVSGVDKSGGGIAGEGGLEFGVVKGALGLGLRGGFAFDAAGDAGYHGWLLEPMAYWAPLEGITFYATPGWVFSGNLVWTEGNTEHSESAMALRLLAGVRVPLLSIGPMRYMLAAEGYITRSQESDAGHAYSGSGFVMSGLLSF